MYDQKTDRLIGFSGESGESHQCNYNLLLNVGSSFADLENTFKTHDIGGNARVVMLNPIHKLLPSAVVFLQATCNRFTAEDVKKQWESLFDLYTECGLSEALGPLIG